MMCTCTLNYLLVLCPAQSDPDLGDFLWFHQDSQTFGVVFTVVRTSHRETSKYKECNYIRVFVKSFDYRFLMIFLGMKNIFSLLFAANSNILA